MDETTRKLGVIGTIVVVGAAILLAMQHLSQAKLRAENDALRQQLEQSAQLAAENQRLSNLVAQAKSRRSLSDDHFSELLKLRGEVGRLREQVKEVEALREATRRAAVALAAGQKPAGADPTPEPPSADFWPRDSWQFQGYATPEAALQSQFYAIREGDLKTFMAYTTGQILEQMEKDIQGKSEAQIAEKMTGETKDLRSVRILKRQTLPDGTVSLTAAFDEGTQTHESSMILTKVGNDWKITDTRAFDPKAVYGN